LKFAQCLKEVGVPDKQAEANALVEVFSEAMESQLSTAVLLAHLLKWEF